MPWHLSKSKKCPISRPWAVIKTSNGSVAGCHKSKAGAAKQLVALKVNVHTLLNIDQVTSMLCMSRATLYRHMRSGNFPKPLANWGRPRWSREQIHDFMEHQTGR